MDPRTTLLLLEIVALVGALAHLIHFVIERWH